MKFLNVREIMKSKVLVLFTNQYPMTEVRETFLENELPYIGSFFKRVIFIPLMPEATQCKSTIDTLLTVPFNVILPLKTWEMMRDESRNRLKTIFSFYLWRDIWNEYKSQKRYDISKKKKPFRSTLDRIAYAERLVDFYGTQLRNLLKEDEMPVFESFWFHLGAYLAGRLACVFDSYAIARAHGYDVYHERLNYAPFHASAMPYLRALYPCSENGTRLLREELPEATSRIHCAYLGTENKYPEKEWVPAPQFHMVTCSSVLPVKRIHLVIDTLKLLGDFSIRWTHLGDSPNPAYAKEIEARLKELEAFPQIQVHFSGKLSNEKVLEFYNQNSVNVFVNVSESEGLPVSMMEALSFSIPVIGTDVGGVSEIISNGENGWLIPCDDAVESLKLKLLEMRGMDSSSYTQLRKGARTRWESFFNAHTNYPAFFEKLANDFDS